MANVAFLAIHSLGALLQPVREGQVVSLNCSRLILGEKGEDHKALEETLQEGCGDSVARDFQGKTSKDNGLSQRRF